MKKVIFLFAFLGLIVANNAFASATTTTNGDPMRVTQSWGMTGYATPIIGSGISVADETGISDTCPKWYPRGCFSLVNTEFYRNQMINLAKGLLHTYGADVYGIFPQFSGWYRIVGFETFTQ